jgi:phosphocarrier protein HPr
MSGHSNSQTVKAIVTICNQRGLHARASANFVKCAEQFVSEIKVTRDGESVSGKSIMGLMMLAAGRGCAIEINASGPDANDALNSLRAIVECGFDES